MDDEDKKAGNLLEREEASAADLDEQLDNDYSSSDEKAAYGSSETEDTAGEADHSMPYKPEPKRGKKGFGTGSSKLRKRLLYASPIGLGLIIIVVFAALFLGNLKAVHFATVLRSSGFATFQLSMRRFFADVAFDKAAFTPDSTGRVETRPESKLLRRLITGNDPRTVTQKLGREGSFQYHREGGKIQGFDFDGGKERVTFDDLSQNLYGKNADDLGVRERMGLRKAVTDRVNIRLAERIGVEPRSFRNSFWKGFRELTGIRMNPFVDGARQWAGKKPIDVETEKRLNDMEYQKGGNDVGSGIKQTDDAKKEAIAETEAAVKRGERFRNPEIFKRALTKVGISPDGFTSGVAKATPYVLAGTLYCIGHDLGQTSDRINKSLEEHAARYASDTQAVAEQIRSGKVSAEAVSASNANYDGSATIPPGEASPYYVTATGGSLDKSDKSSLAYAPTTSIETPLDWFKPVDTAVKNAATAGAVNIPVLGGFIDKGADAVINKGCEGLMNPYVQSAFLIADLIAAGATGGASAAAGATFKAALFFGGGHIVGSMIEKYVQSLSGGFTGAESGVDRVNNAGVATNYLNAQSNRGVAMGAPVTKEEAVQSKVTAMLEMHKQYNEQTWQNRYFAIDNPFSLVGSLAARTPTSFASLSYRMGNMFNGLANSFSQLASGALFAKTASLAFSGGYQQRAYADTAASFEADADFFGTAQWDWTAAERYLVETDESFSFDNNAAYVEEHPEFEERYAKCYGAVLQKDLPDECTDTGPNALLRERNAIHWRLYKAHTFVVDEMNIDPSKDIGV